MVHLMRDYARNGTPKHEAAGVAVNTPDFTCYESSEPLAIHCDERLEIAVGHFIPRQRAPRRLRAEFGQFAGADDVHDHDPAVDVNALIFFSFDPLDGYISVRQESG